MTYSADSAGLHALFSDMVAANAAGNIPAAAELLRGLWLDAAAINYAVADEAAAAKLEEQSLRHSPRSDAEAAALLRLRPGRPRGRVHTAPPEEIASYQKGTTAASEFPGGARDAARTVLRPGRTFYEVELLAPGADLGSRYHLFFHDGQRWRILGPIWRMLPRN